MKMIQRLMDGWSRIVFRQRYAEITPKIRILRALEEVMELAQSEDVTIDEINIIRDQVMSKPKGNPFQELGGVMVCLAGYANTRGFDLEDAFLTEFERMSHPKIIEKVRYRNLEGDKIGFTKDSTRRDHRTILIIGGDGHGKTTVGQILKMYAWNPISTSEYLVSKVMMPYFENSPIGRYASAQDCWHDRVNCRDIWKQVIEEYNTPDYTRTTREIFADGYNVQIGIRSRKEFEASKHLFDLIFWVDASKRIPGIPSTSNELTSHDADEVIDNNGSIDELATAMAKLFLKYDLHFTTTIGDSHNA